MRPPRLISFAGLLTLAVAVAACGGSSPAASSASSQAAQSTAASQAAQSQDQPESQAAQPSSGSGVSAGDVEALAADLVPPNSSESSTSQSGGTVWTTYQSTDSTDSLKSFYENAIAQTGMNIYNTTSASGTYTWLFAVTDASSFGGSVTVAPSTSGGSGSTVIVLVTDGT